MILSLTDFNERPYKIPNQNESTDLSDFIARTEEQALIDLFGYEFYQLMITDYETSGGGDQIYIDLVEGAEYEYDGVTYKWKGLVDLLKPYVYAKWIDAGSYKLTNVGFIQNAAQQNSTLLDSEQFKVQYLNEYAAKANGMYNALYGFVEVNSDNYPLLSWNSPITYNRFGL